MNEDEAILSLKHVKMVLDEEGVDFWLDCGTLLGAVRDGKIIPWDNDIDLGAWRKDFDRIDQAIQRLQNEIYTVHHPEEVKIICGYSQVNITLYRLKDDEATRSFVVEDNYFSGFVFSISKLLEDEKNAISVSENIPISFTNALGTIFSKIPSKIRSELAFVLKNLHEMCSSKVIVSVPSKYFTDLSKIEFYGMEFSAPSPIEEYLKFRYGDDWRTPKKDYVYYEDDQSIKEED